MEKVLDKPVLRRIRLFSESFQSTCAEGKNPNK